MLPPNPAMPETKDEMTFYSLAQSYQEFMGSPAWEDVQMSLDVLAAAAEEKALNLQPGAGETARLEALMEWRQLRLVKHAMTSRAETLIESLTERMTTHGDPVSSPEPDTFLPAL